MSPLRGVVLIDASTSLGMTETSLGMTETSLGMTETSLGMTEGAAKIELAVKALVK